MRKILSLILILFTMCLLGACEKEGLSVDIAESSSDSVVQGADESGTLAVGENGIFSLKNNHFMYFDYVTEKNYVICNRANCRHNNDGCSGWYEGYQGAYGLAEYCGKIYCFIFNEDSNALELISMKRDGSERKTVSKIQCGDSTPNSWNLVERGKSTYYAGGKAFTTLYWMYNPDDKSEEDVQTQQSVAIDLNSGKIIELTERKKESVECEISGISKDHCIITMKGEAGEYLSETEFYKEFETGGFDSVREIKNAENPYEAYYMLRSTEIPWWYKFIAFDNNKNQTTLIQEGTIEPSIDEDGDCKYMLPFVVSGIHNDYAIIETLKESKIDDEGVVGVSENHIYKWFFDDDGKIESLLDIDDGYMFDAGGIEAGVTVDDNKLLYLKRKPKMMAEYYSYNIDTGKEQKMYDAERDVPYRIIGETKDKFIYYTYDDKKKYMNIIKKSDYYRGNFKNATRIEALDEEF